ncbi:MAG TPA: efflux transporter outer membrane subunit [Sphingomicrobium sp.]|jgi:multidrug efflux system outer membrane protein|nr:efflux transporter outer membrane subunit [Sphingomicrobium sp.]
MRRFAGLLALLASGCMSLEPHYVRPESAVPASWPVGDAYLAQSEAALPAVTYKEIFRDPRLQTLIQQALVNNRDLMAAAANIAAAREQYRIQRAGQLPVVNAGAGTTVTGDKGGNVNATYTAGLNVPSFELDLFGRVRSLSHAQLERYFATEAAGRATRLALVASIADAWLVYGADSSLLGIANDTARSAATTVKLTRARLEGGVAPRTDLSQAQQILTGAEADVARQTTLAAQDVNALQLLVGAPIDPALLPKSIDEAAPTVAELPAGLDSSILLRRPDVLEAEYQLRAANAQIGAARAALFPRISLTGLLGLASEALTKLFSGGAFGWSAGADATYTIFQGGAGRANVRLSEAQRNAAVADYQKAIQTAFREVADALARRGTMGKELMARTEQTAAAADALKLSEARYRAGIENFLATLDAQRSAYSSQQVLVQTKLESAQNLVDLYQSLGGDDLLRTVPVGTGD